MEPEDDKSETSTSISTLPDSILCHILSFLPTRTSIATSVLSRRWRHLWKHLHVLNLDGYSFNTPELSRDHVEDRFVDFVNEVLHQVQVRRIQKFRLEGEVRNYSCTLSFWIDAVTSEPHLQELYLSLWNTSGSFYTLPYSVFSCTSLVSLVLKGDIIVSFDNLQSLQLPSLKNLDLEIISTELDKLLSLCPALETLKVFIFFNSGGIDPNEIHVPRSLKRLTLESEACDSTVDHLEIHTPSLEYLDIALVACYSQISVRTYPNLVEACLNICFDDMHIDWMPKLLNAVCGTKFLALQASTTACLICVPSLEFPQFCCLVRLQIGFEFFNSRVLIDLLHCCCKLEALLIHACESVSYGCLYGEPVEPSSWTQPVSVPSCVVSHLNIIEFRDYEDLEEEHEFIAYVIERGLVLKTVTIHTRTFTDQEIKDHILKKLSVVPMGSSICQLKLE